MLNAIIMGLARNQTPTPLFSSRLPYHTGQRSTSGLKFRQAESEAKANQPQKLEQQKQTNDHNTKTGDLMSHSFGEGYATRSDEEGFGRIYRGNASISKEEQDRIIHDNYPWRFSVFGLSFLD
ncbi:hypothetical protein CsSME_00005841 [Camellia sinensis var. sinensis]